MCTLGLLNNSSCAVFYLNHLPTVSVCVFVFIQVWQWADSGSGGSWKWERSKGQSLSGKHNSGGRNIHPAPEPRGVCAFHCMCTFLQNHEEIQLGPNNDSASGISDCLTTHDCQLDSVFVNVISALHAFVSCCNNVSIHKEKHWWWNSAL